MNRLTDGLIFNAQALVLRAERQRLLASNIANADTPGYAARDFDFAKALREATAQAKSANAHGTGDLSGAMASAREHAARNLVYAASTQTNLDGNTVDMDRQRAAFADNAVKYESTLRFVNGSVKTMLDAMKAYNQP